MKMDDESKAMRKIRRIRRKQCEETKDFSPEEHMAYIKKNPDEFQKESGIVFRCLSISSK